MSFDVLPQIALVPSALAGKNVSDPLDTGSRRKARSGCVTSQESDLFRGLPRCH